MRLHGFMRQVMDEHRNGVVLHSETQDRAENQAEARQ